jgi:phosphoribosyl 1,2-cyclic phosphate phosphodiesterase
VDTPPDLRTQLLREDIRLVNGVLFTHEHADHLFGLDDLRLFPFKLGGPVPLFCAPHVEARIRHTFDYAFDSRDETHPGARPQLVFRSIHDSPFDAIGLSVVPIPMQHGPHFETLGFRFGDFAYCTDTNGIPPTSVARLRGVRTLVLGALRHEPHPTHFTIEQAIAMAQMIAPERTFLTHLSHDIDYETTSRALPPGIHLAFDGLRVNANLDVV